LHLALLSAGKRVSIPSGKHEIFPEIRMSNIGWIIGGIAAAVVAIFVIWYAIKVFTGVVVVPENSGRALLKQELKNRGVEVGRIPDMAFDEIVSRCVDGARGLAAVNDQPIDKSFQVNFVRYLVGEATIINIILGDEHSPLASGATKDTLVKYEVISSN
jgi:hypothetical protein